MLLYLPAAKLSYLTVIKEVTNFISKTLFAADLMSVVYLENLHCLKRSVHSEKPLQTVQDHWENHKLPGLNSKQRIT